MKLILKLFVASFVLTAFQHLNGQTIVRQYGADCTSAPQAFVLTGCDNCTGISWSISGPDNYSGSTTGFSVGGFSWSSAGSYSVSASYSGGGNTSSSYSVTIYPSVTPNVGISTASTTVCVGVPVTFSTTQSGGGSAPSYYFKVNGTIVQSGSSSSFTTSSLVNGDQVKVTMLSNASCFTGSQTDDSPTLTMTVNTTSPPTVSNVTIPMGTNTTLTASGKGANESYRWYTLPSGGSSWAGDSYVTSTLNVQTTFYVSKYNSVTLCESTRTPLIVNVFDPNMSVPPVPTVSSNSCGVKTLSFSNPPANVTYYWQGTDENGYSTSQSVNASSSITIYNTARYYLKGKHSSGNYWSINTYVDVTITNPIAPPTPTVSPNTCGDKTVSRGTPSDGSTWYWQGTNSAGVDVSSAAAASSFVLSTPGTTTQYIRAFKLIPGQQTGCWSSAAGVSVTVIKPAMPAMPTVSTLTCGPKTLTKVGTPPGGISWYWQGTAQTQDISSTAAASTYEAQTTNTYYLGARDGNNCWTYRPIQVIVEPETITINQYDPVNTTVEATRQIILGPGFTAPHGSPFVAKIGISAACEDRINWVESLAYGQDGAVIADSKSYSSGLGMGLQSQSRDFVNNKIFASQPLYDSYNSPSAQTLAAPMIWSDFRYQKDFVRNVSGAPYGKNDFDKNLTAEAGAVDNPNPVGADKPYTLGWYYSSGNNLEALTPVTSYPYSRSYSPADPDPTIGKSSGAGDNYKMGSGHEVVSERQLSTSTELSHYSSIRAHFVTSTLPVVGYKSIVTDPDGKKIVSFEDADGRSLASATLTGSVYDNWSYNFYNDIGQLVASVAPNGVNTASNSLPAFVTKYSYDHLGQLIQVESPDEGISKFVYNLDGEVRFSENQEQRNASPKRFSYSNYDYLGRLVESGEYTSSAGGYFFEPQVASASASLSVLHLVDTHLPRGMHVDDLSGATDPLIFKGPSWKIDPSRCADYTLIKYDESSNAPGSQENLDGQISKTQNENTTTWYSYDEFAQLKVMWQQIAPMANAQKKIEYTYDYFGNVTLVAYQAGVFGEQFYHHYEYDAGQKLIKVSTSFDGSTKTVRASYKYYLHGPLKRVELGDKVQGVDYVYNIDGSLKLINHPDPAMDPGYDGLSGSNASFAKDIFGEALDYSTNDYVGAGYNAGTVTTNQTTYPDRFGGIVKSIRWHSQVDSHVQRAYAFEYDDLNQMKVAKWGSVTGSGGAYGLSIDPNAYREEITGSPDPYDKNGNIKGLTRMGKTGTTPIANFQYNYYPNTNKLQTVVADGDDISYTYNSIGQMISQTEGAKVIKPIYNASGLVKEIRNGLDLLMTEYKYDDRGNVIAKIVHDADTITNPPIDTTYYMSDAGGNVLAIYGRTGIQASTIQVEEVPIYGSGRIAVYKPLVQTIFYEVSDHLGNVRGVIGNPETLIYTATIEDNGLVDYTNPRVQELAVFKNLAATEKDDADMNHTASSSSMPTPVYSAYLRWISGQSGNGLTQSVGPAIGLKVEPGDKIDMQVWGKFKKVGTSYSRGSITGTVASILGNNFVGSAGGIDVIGSATQVFSNGFAQAVGTAVGNGNDDSTLPYAYLYYFLYDKSFNLITSGSARMPATAGYDPLTELRSKPHQLLSIPTRTITEPGYIYIFVANESENTEVWFDDLNITHERSTIVAGADYYPYGLAMENREITREDYRFGYQGQFSEEDKTTGWNEFELRNYDPRIGRWLSTDPYSQFNSPYLAMSNNPSINIDPDGGWSWVGMGVGAAVGTGVAFAVGDEKHWYYYAAAGAVAGGFAGEWAHSSGGKDVQTANVWDRFTSLFGEGQIQPGGNTFSRWRPMGTKPMHVAKAPSQIEKPVRAEPRARTFPVRTLPSLVDASVKARLPRITTRSVTAKYRFSGYSDEALNQGWDVEQAAKNLYGLYTHQSKTMRFSHVTISFTSTKPTLAVRNYVKKIIRKLKALGVPQKAIVEEVLPIKKYENPKFKDDQVHGNVTGTQIRVK